MSLEALLFQALNGLAAASSLFFVGAGLSLIFGVTRVVNFAHGSLAMLGAYVAWSIGDALTERLGDSAWAFALAVAGAALAAALVGALIEALILKRLYAAPELLQLTATFAIVLVVRDIALAIWGAEDLLGHRQLLLSMGFDKLGHSGLQNKCIPNCSGECKRLTHEVHRYYITRRQTPDLLDFLAPHQH